MSEFELWQLVDAQQRTVTDQFQFWMAATFAVVIASYTAGYRLALWARIALAIIYLFAAMLFFVRYQQATDFLGQLIQLLDGSELSHASGTFPSFLRRTVMIAGSLFAVILVCLPGIGDRQKISNDS